MRATIATPLFLFTVLAAAATAGGDECTLDEVVFGKQLLGPHVMEEDCEGRVTLFVVWGIT
jgi:hypothetical protein